MSRGPKAAIWRPSAQQVRLLRAGLLDREAALGSWREWREHGGDVDELEEGAFRLLPLVYRNLGGDLDDPDTGRLKGIYRRSWTVNQISTRIGRRALEALRSDGVETLLLKGGALLGTAYRDVGARPMGDMDVAVPEEKVGAAVAALETAGFESTEPNPVRLLKVRHSQAFKDEDGLEVDLHRGMLWRPGLDQEFWRESVEIDLMGVPTRSLCPADQLLHVCIHGAAWNPVEPVRWAADACKTLEAAGEDFNWERLVQMATRGRLSLPLHDALTCLSTELEVAVPPKVLDQLAAVPLSHRERRAHEVLAQPPSSRRSAAMLWWFWERHHAQAALDDARPGPRRFVRYLQGFWGLESASDVPGHAARRLLRRRG